jgi:16S rRNA (uracil1498-N3)-methyltransferase
MSLARFYLSPDHWSGTNVFLDGEQAKHCAQVMRHGVGDSIVVFDGKGRACEASIRKADSKRVDLDLGETKWTPAPAIEVTLVQAIPKGSNMDLIIEKAVELGVSHIRPILTERTIVRLDTAEALKKQQKWQRTVLEACKQCGQNWLPTMHATAPFQDVLESNDATAVNLIAAILPEARDLKTILASREQGKAAFAQISICIGPEGDFTPAEYALAMKCGLLPLSMGPTILRVETAALFALSIIQHELRSAETAR